MRSGRIVAIGALLLGIGACYVLTTGAAAARGYSLKNLRGNYAGEFSGTIFSNSTALLMSGTGLFTADGKGHIGGHESYTLNGTPCNATVSGTYAVNPDGTGTLSAEFNASGPGCESGSYTQSFAIGDSGHTVVLANSNKGQGINEVWRLQK